MSYKEISLKGSYGTRTVYLNNKPLDPVESQQIRNHSPDGFNWGYGGSGPAQLSLSVLLECFDKDVALRNYQKFKNDVIAGLPNSDFDVKIDVSYYSN